MRNATLRVRYILEGFCVAKQPDPENVLAGSHWANSHYGEASSPNVAPSVSRVVHIADTQCPHGAGDMDVARAPLTFIYFCPIDRGTSALRLDTRGLRFCRVLD